MEGQKREVYQERTLSQLTEGKERLLERFTWRPKKKKGNYASGTREEHSMEGGESGTTV